jgi:AraC-like DNA-binding protein
MVFASPHYGFERRPAWDALPRHRHRTGYLALILEGSYEEAGDRGRFRVEPGDMLIHGAFDAHLNRFPASGARILNLALPEGVQPELGLSRPAAADLAIRIAERDPDAAARLLTAGATVLPAARLDWPDRLAADLIDDPSLRIGEWATAHGLADATVSRGFRQVYGASPNAFRAQQRARLAWSRIVNDGAPLAELAYSLGFADQAHMTRTVRAITGAPPTAWRIPVK